MPLRFDWDQANVAKIWLKHRVGPDEAESVFDDPSRYVAVTRDVRGEMRYLCVGASNKEKLRTAVYTKRGQRIRIISCRHANKKETRRYLERKNLAG